MDRPKIRRWLGAVLLAAAAFSSQTWAQLLFPDSPFPWGIATIALLLLAAYILREDWLPAIGQADHPHSGRYVAGALALLGVALVIWIYWPVSALEQPTSTAIAPPAPATTADIAQSEQPTAEIGQQPTAPPPSVATKEDLASSEDLVSVTIDCISPLPPLRGPITLSPDDLSRSILFDIFPIPLINSTSGIRANGHIAHGGSRPVEWPRHYNPDRSDFETYSFSTRRCNVTNYSTKPIDNIQIRIDFIDSNEDGEKDSYFDVAMIDYLDPGVDGRWVLFFENSSASVNMEISSTGYHGSEESLRVELTARTLPGSLVMHFNGKP